MQAQLYLADQRGCTQTDVFRSFHSFNFGGYSNEHRKPVGSLQVVNDDTLKAGHGINLRVDEPTEVILIPIVGGLEYKSPAGTGFVAAGQIQVLSLDRGMSYDVINPYETEWINFIQIWLANNSRASTPGTRQTDFDLTQTNRLLPAFSIGSQPDALGFIGKFDGRAEGAYTPDKAENGVFVFVLAGVFEVQHRLLHERDGLALLHPEPCEVEFEALSNEAILLIVDIPVFC